MIEILGMILITMLGICVFCIKSSIILALIGSLLNAIIFCITLPAKIMMSIINKILKIIGGI